VPTLRDRFNKTAARLHTAAYRRSGGRIGKTMGKAPVGLLTTVGRRSGQPRTVPVIFLAEGDRWYLVASNAGQDHHPAWYGNLLAHPEASIRIGDTDTPVVARQADDDERAAAWPKLAAQFPGYDKYVEKTDRRIPVMVLSPR
jgi:deazaflavin-dependent oxidoreductase (nitroreductase family)